MSTIIKIHSFPLSGHAHRVELFANVAGIAHEVINVDLAATTHAADSGKPDEDSGCGRRESRDDTFEARRREHPDRGGASHQGGSVER